jgi:hypothetical protein
MKPSRLETTCKITLHLVASASLADITLLALAGIGAYRVRNEMRFARGGRGLRTPPQISLDPSIYAGIYR